MLMVYIIFCLIHYWRGFKWFLVYLGWKFKNTLLFFHPKWNKKEKTRSLPSFSIKATSFYSPHLGTFDFIGLDFCVRDGNRYFPDKINASNICCEPKITFLKSNSFINAKYVNLSIWSHKKYRQSWFQLQLFLRRHHQRYQENQ